MFEYYSAGLYSAGLLYVFGSLLCSAVHQNTIGALCFVENSRHAPSSREKACLLQFLC